MTNTHLLYELQMLAEDALAMLKNDNPDRACVMLVNLISLLDDEYEHACNEECSNIPDDVDETFYNPYTGCNEYESYSFYEEY